jgi:hypothetical protein
MASNYQIDQSATMRELLTPRQRMWENVTKASVFVTLAVVALLFSLLLVFVIF